MEEGITESNLDGSGSMTSKDNLQWRRALSELANAYLDNIGYSKERIKERTHCMDKCSAAKTISNQRIMKRDDVIKTFVGSCREGTGLSYINDTDVLQIYKKVQCMERAPRTVDNDHVVFVLDSNNIPAGHYYLRLHHFSPLSRSYEDIKYALVPFSGRTYLSSQQYMKQNDDVFASSDGWIARNTVYEKKKGPSLPKYTETDKYLMSMLTEHDIHLNKSFDFVRGFPCHCPSVIQRWKDRARQHEWPQQQDIDTAAQLPACVVPVGVRGSDNQQLQWRLCFTLTEIHLIKSMNNTHTKVHVLLKQIAKHYLQPDCEDITSYVVKNVMLWQAEGRPVSDYQPRYLLDRLLDALLYLQYCIQQRHLPNYMIPERNLFKGKLKSTPNNNIESKLNHVIENLLVYSSIILTNDLENIPQPLQRIVLAQVFGNWFDRISTCQVSGITVGKLASFFEHSFHIKNGLWYRIYSRAFVFGWCILRFRHKIFTDPMAIDHQKVLGNLDDVKNNLCHTVWKSDSLTGADPVGNNDSLRAESEATESECLTNDNSAENSLMRTPDKDQTMPIQNSPISTTAGDTTDQIHKQDKLHEDKPVQTEKIKNNKKSPTSKKKATQSTSRKDKLKKTEVKLNVTIRGPDYNIMMKVIDLLLVVGFILSPYWLPLLYNELTLYDQIQYKPMEYYILLIYPYLFWFLIIIRLVTIFFLRERHYKGKVSPNVKKFLKKQCRKRLEDVPVTIDDRNFLCKKINNDLYVLKVVQ